MPHVSPSLSRVLALAMLLSSASADTIVLKSGERIEGRVISETATDLKLEVKVSAGITDERTVAKADVEKIEKVAADAEAYKVVGAIQPGANSASVAQYDQAIRTLQAFLTQYPKSTHAADVQKALIGFEGEKKRVEAGEVKLDGQWLSKEEVDKERVQISGRIALNYMKSQAAAGDYLGALNTFAALEKPYGTAATFPDSVELAEQVIARLGPVVEAAIPNQKALKAEREKGFADAGAADRTELKAAYKRELDAAEDAVADATKAGQWPPLIAISEKSLTALQAQIKKEGDRLAKLPTDKMRKSLQLVEEAKKKLAAREIDAANTAVTEATKQWPANELAVRLTKEVAAAKAASKSTPAPAATSTPKTTPKATPKPSAALKAAAAPSAPAEEEKPFFMTLPGAISIVVGLAMVLGGANLFLKMKKRKDAAPQ